MVPPPAPGPNDQSPYFFLSYAHIPSHDPARRDDPNRWVKKLFEDLCEHINNLTNLRPGAAAGFMDVELRSGHHWPERLSEALATCRVFVPLYSPRYFESEQCGKEWAAFLHRLSNHANPEGQLPEAIVPALWIPLPPHQLPEVAKSIQFAHEGQGPRYRDEGFYGLIKVSSMRSQYQRATLTLARRIVEVAARTRISVMNPTPEYQAFASPFRDYLPQRPLKVTVAAPSLSGLPKGRNPYYYGHTPQGWNPYRCETSTRPLAAYAADIAAAHGFQAEIGSLEEHANELTSETPLGPAVMLVDPWATTRADCQAQLRKVDRGGKRWVGVVVPWNDDDGQTARERARLRRSVDQCLPGRPSETSADVDSLSAFHRVLPDLLGKAANQFFRTAPAYPPAGPSSRKPRLMDPEDRHDQHPG
ncbi:TIR domain-containing protein [Microbispora sp. RL4-1S]|uniref:TIR domain-containing protein n=1 Tax=Microbispora oryzae TaxID=2806554 RepID=A0A941AHG0_9ACTN|nr:TIR-like protein FxsC [Microbispora oryzae]MBP2704051.1 TIR domain-containing protein [Microbispora oryzae]